MMGEGVLGFYCVWDHGQHGLHPGRRGPLMALAKPTVEDIKARAARYPSKQSAIIPALWAVQHEQGYVTKESMGEIAQILGLPPSLIEATASFYSMFLTKPEGRHDVVICVNAPCMLRG